MRTIDFPERIFECSRQAETAPNLQARLVWKLMEQFWRMRAARPSQPTKTFEALRFVPNSPLGMMGDGPHRR
jgi:hypothetical protein